MWNKNVLNELTIVKVYYIYTQFRQSETFEQLELDRKRFDKLSTYIPGILEDPYIEWEVIEQTGCENPEEGDDYFHGFVLVHRPRMTEEERQREIEKLSAFLDDPTQEFVEEKLDNWKIKFDQGSQINQRR